MAEDVSPEQVDLLKRQLEWERIARRQAEDIAERGILRLYERQQLDRLLRALGFTQAKADSQVRWAVLNVVTLLRRHSAAHDALAAGMVQGKSVAECVAIIESALSSVTDI